MNRRLLFTAFRQEYRKYALRFSLILHVIGILVFSLFFIKSEVHESEDEIHVDILPQLPRQRIVKKQAIAIPKKDAPKPEEEIPIPKQEIRIAKKENIEKQVKVIAPKHSLEIAKMSSPQPPADTQKIKDSVLPAALEAPYLSTNAALKPVPESVLSPRSGDTSTPAEENFGRRKATGAKTPGKGSESGIGERIKGTESGKADGIRNTTTGTGNEFSSIIKQLADDIIASSGGGPVDVVFVVDASGSMGDNINAVAEHLGKMIDAYKASEIDYQLGLTHFNIDKSGKNNIQVWQLKRNLSEYKRMLYAIIPTGDENALDAIDYTLSEMRFRRNTTKHFILVTDESFTSSQGLTVEDAIKACRRNEIFVNVLGNQIGDHRRLATQTGGTWHVIPLDPMPKQNLQQQNKTQTPLTISERIREDAANIPTDIVFFIDGSKSMADNMTYLKEHIDVWIRDWDNALIDYRVGVVRFHASGTINRVNVFNPPQTQKQIHAILQLPTNDDENLLHAIVEGSRRIKIRPNAKTHFIVFTDEPGNPKYPITGTIQLLQEIPVVVSVIGTNDNFQQQVAWQTGGIWVAIPNAQNNNHSYH